MSMPTERPYSFLEDMRQRKVLARVLKEESALETFIRKAREKHRYGRANRLWGWFAWSSRRWIMVTREAVTPFAHAVLRERYLDSNCDPLPIPQKAIDGLLRDGGKALVEEFGKRVEKW
jgi:hypothetical protein